MSSPLELLPSELLDCILEYLIDHDIGALRASDKFDCTSLSRLSQCSHSLNRRLEQLLFSTVSARNAAIEHGCVTGNLHAIRKAVSCGGDPGTVDEVKKRGHAHSSSLQVALTKGQFEAFDLLLELGAGLPINEEQVVYFGQRLAEQKNEAFLRAFIEARAETPWEKIKNDHDDFLKQNEDYDPNDKEDYDIEESQAHAVVSRMPFPRIVSWAALELLETLLDHGATLNQAVEKRKKGLITTPLLTPLGAACLRGDIDVFNLLVARGEHVEIDNALRSKHATTYTHIPVFVAAQYMAETGKTDMLDACVARGADLNRPCHIPTTSLSEEQLSENDKEPHRCTTPFLTYLSSIKSWESKTTNPPHLTPREGVAHFIHTLGVTVPSPILSLIKHDYSNADQELHDRLYAGIPSPVELLLVKNGIESLALPDFFSVNELLIQHGGTEPDLARTLVRIEGENANNDDPSSPDIESLWKKFLECLKLEIDALDIVAKNALLRRVILDKTRLRHRVAHPSRWIKVRALGRQTVSFLVHTIGCDINFVDTSLQQTLTPLHELISSFISAGYLAEDFMHDHPADQTCAYTADVVANFGAWLSFLLGLGADPWIEDTATCRGDEKTVFDTLVSPMRKGTVQYPGGLVEQGLMSFVTTLKGKGGEEGEREVYTGEREEWTDSFWGMSRSFYWGGVCPVADGDVDVDVDGWVAGWY